MFASSDRTSTSEAIAYGPHACLNDLRNELAVGWGRRQMITDKL